MRRDAASPVAATRPSRALRVGVVEGVRDRIAVLRAKSASAPTSVTARPVPSFARTETEMPERTKFPSPTERPTPCFGIDGSGIASSRIEPSRSRPAAGRWSV